MQMSVTALSALALSQSCIQIPWLASFPHIRGRGIARRSLHNQQSPWGIRYSGVELRADRWNHMGKLIIFFPQLFPWLFVSLQELNLCINYTSELTEGLAHLTQPLRCIRKHGVRTRVWRERASCRFLLKSQWASQKQKPPDGSGRVTVCQASILPVG